MLDVIIVGGGVAGLTAGLYANRGGLSTLLFERMFPGGQASTTGLIENYPGFDEPISGPDLVEKMENQAQKFGLKILYDEVTGLDLEGRTKKVEAGGKTYECKAVILAMGAEPRQLGLEKEKEFRGKGILRRRTPCFCPGMSVRLIWCTGAIRCVLPEFWRTGFWPERMWKWSGVRKWKLFWGKTG